MIYKDWNDYWTKGNHGFSSASRDMAKDIWDDFQDTINATRTDYENLLIAEAVHQKKVNIEWSRAMIKYLTEFDLEKHAPIKFFRWFYENSKT